MELAYTTPPFGADTVLAGPVGATIYATATAADTAWIVTLDDVAPGGSARSLTSGALQGSHRALDETQSWRAADGNLLLPYHPYTRTAQMPVTPGEVTRYDIEVFPTTALLASGHQLRVRIATADVPHLVPTPMQLSHLAGGVYQVQWHAQAASLIELPLAPAAAFPNTLVPALGAGSK